MLVDGSGSVTGSGRRATGDPNYYKNYVFKALKDIINQFNVAEDQTHIGTLFYGDKDMSQIKADVSIIDCPLIQ